MFTKFVLPLLAVCGLGFAVYNVAEMRKVPPPSQPAIEPPSAPKVRSIAGAGLVEAKRENIPIGVTVPGVVDKVFVVIGQSVKAGDPLFHVDDRELRAELIAREASVVSARSSLARLKAAPRAEDVPPAVATVEEAKAKLEDARAALRRSKSLNDRKMIAAGDYDKDNYAEKAAVAMLAKAEADLFKIRAGSWVEDIKVAEAALLQAESQVQGLKIQIERLTVKTYADGQVLQVHVRPGQFAALQWNEPLIVLGDVDRLHVRVDIDETDLPYINIRTEGSTLPRGPAAIATLKGRPGTRFPLDFVKVEPYVIPKKSLTGDNSERVDTRVLQVVYALKDAPTKVYVGQQMDVYLEAEAPKGITLDGGPQATRPFEDDSKLAPPTVTVEPSHPVTR